MYKQNRLNAAKCVIPTTRGKISTAQRSPKWPKRVAKRPKVGGGDGGTEAGILTNGPFDLEIAAFRSWRRF